MNIFEAIRKDHDKQRELCRLVTSTSGDSKGRKEMWEKLKHELKIHADAEERTFYSPLIHTHGKSGRNRYGFSRLACVRKTTM